jgi:GNAT superfamily N-acetyltransferase
MKAKEMITIKKVTQEDIPQMLEFVMKVRREEFPTLNNDVLPHDLLHFEEAYIHPRDAVFLAAFSKEGSIMGSIAVSRYDGRVKAVEGWYDLQTTAEILKCYVDKDARRSGIGSLLVKEAINFSRECGYETAYLHTHRFLPGAVQFWQSHGYAIKLEEGDSMQTVHMDRRVMPL